MAFKSSAFTKQFIKFWVHIVDIIFFILQYFYMTALYFKEHINKILRFPSPFPSGVTCISKSHFPSMFTHISIPYVTLENASLEKWLSFSIC